MSTHPIYLKGTVTDDIANTVRTSKSSFDFKADKHGVLHTGKEEIDRNCMRSMAYL